MCKWCRNVHAVHPSLAKMLILYSRMNSLIFHEQHCLKMSLFNLLNRERFRLPVILLCHTASLPLDGTFSFGMIKMGFSGSRRHWSSEDCIDLTCPAKHSVLWESTLQKYLHHSVILTLHVSWRLVAMWWWSCQTCQRLQFLYHQKETNRERCYWTWSHGQVQNVGFSGNASLALTAVTLTKIFQRCRIVKWSAPELSCERERLCCTWSWIALFHLWYSSK